MRKSASSTNEPQPSTWVADETNRTRFKAVWLIYAREMRDQLRDRRTLFTIVLLPILLYPLVGTLLLQIAQFSREHKTVVCIVGSEYLPQSPPLIQDQAFASELLSSSKTPVELVLHTHSELGQVIDIPWQTERWVREGTFDAVLVIPPTFAETPLTDAAKIQLLYNVASDESLVARDRLIQTLNAWRGGWVRQRLADRGIDLKVLDPFQIADQDIAPASTREASLWSKLLPFVMLVWAMTGAFYPAIDLVAGEKERGTLETLLCSPALRSEVVWGKLAAVTTFSMLTAILNAASMLFTSSFVFNQLGIGANGTALGAPPLGAMLWLLVALVPLSALFSALALAVAAIARSSKEGQYYLMPLMMVTLPLVLLPMIPGTTLNPGTSVIPVTGMFLLVRALVEGQYLAALWHMPAVFFVTILCLYLAARWARRQFEDESVLFGDGDQWELGRWARHLWRDRQATATPAQAFACAVVILMALFFGKLAVTEIPSSFAGIAGLVLAPQLGMILAPTLIMAFVSTTSLRKSLRIRMPHWSVLPLAVLLGICLHPMYVQLAQWISVIYPISEQAAEAMRPFSEAISAAPLLYVLLLIAVVPAICEELAFRGFIFGGLVRDQSAGRAVLLTAVIFGISHGVLQQSICATIMGLLLGWISWKTGSVLPSILIHVTNNALSASLERIVQSGSSSAEFFVRSTAQGPQYQSVWSVIAILIAGIILCYFHSIDHDGDGDVLTDRCNDPCTSIVPVHVG